MKTSNKLIVIASVFAVVVMLITTFMVKSTIMSTAVQGNGKAIDKTYSLEGITSLNITGFQTELIPSDKEEVVLSIDENLAYTVQFSKENNMLDVSIKKDSIYNSITGIKLKIYSREMDSIRLVYSKLSGTLKGSKVVLSVLGSSDANIVFEGSRLDVTSVNSSNVSLEGKCDTLNVDIKNSSSFDSKKFKANICNINAVNSARAHVYGIDEINANLSNSSKLVYYGEAKLNRVETNNSSSIKKGK